MAEYTITAVSDQIRDWESTKGGAMKSYRVHMRDGANVLIEKVEWARKASSPPPAVGQKVEGTVDTEGQFGPKFKQQAIGGGGFAGGSRPRDPGERRSIQMQHAQKCAVEALRVAAEFGGYKPPAGVDVAANVKAIARMFFEQIEEVAA